MRKNRSRRDWRGAVRRSPRRSAVLLLATVVVLALVGYGAYAATSSSGTTYRTTTVTKGSVASTLSLVATAAPGSIHDAEFAASGTVVSVPVTVGEQVKAGTVLASLDASTEQEALDEQEATVARDQLTLQEAEDGESTGASSTGSASFTAASSSLLTASSPATTAKSGYSGKGGSTSVAGAQQALLLDQKALDADLASAKVLLSDASRLCAAQSSATPTPTPTTTSTSTTTPNFGSSPRPSGSPTGGHPTHSAPTTCLGAETDLLAQENTVNTAETKVTADETALNKLIAASATTSSSTSHSSTSGGSSSRTSTVPSAAQLAADQATVDAAQAMAAVDEQNLAAMKLVATSAGTVTSVGVTVGEAVTASSATEDIVIVNSSGGYVVTSTVPVTELSSIKTGLPATITPDGSSKALTGTLSAIGVAPTTSGGTTYPITISVNGTSSALRDGSTANVTITLGSTSGQLTVPTSAVHTVGTLTIVDVLTGGKEVATRVVVGTVGPERTVITSGLKAGQQVVLADLKTPIPTSSTSTTTRGFGGTTGFGGAAGGFGGATGGFGAGGFGGGARG